MLWCPPSVRRKVQGLKAWTPGRKRQKKSTHRHQEHGGTAAFFQLPADGDKKVITRFTPMRRHLSRQKLPVCGYLPPFKILCATDILTHFLQAAEETRLASHQERLSLPPPVPDNILDATPTKGPGPSCNSFQYLSYNFKVKVLASSPRFQKYGDEKRKLAQYSSSFDPWSQGGKIIIQKQRKTRNFPWD